MKPHTETREFTFHLTFNAQFSDDYDGDDDGYAWAQKLPTIEAAMLRALVAVVGEDKAWSIRTTNRGRSSEDEVALVLERTFR